MPIARVLPPRIDLGTTLLDFVGATAESFSSQAIKFKHHIISGERNCNKRWSNKLMGEKCNFCVEVIHIFIILSADVRNGSSRGLKRNTHSSFQC